MVAVYTNLGCFLRDIFEGTEIGIAERPGTVADKESNIRLCVRVTGQLITKLHPRSVQISIQNNICIRAYHPKLQSFTVECRYHRVIVLRICIAPPGKDIIGIFFVQGKYLKGRRCISGKHRCSHALVCGHLNTESMRPVSNLSIELHHSFNDRILRVRNRAGQIQPCFHIAARRVCLPATIQRYLMVCFIHIGEICTTVTVSTRRCRILISQRQLGRRVCMIDRQSSFIFSGSNHIGGVLQFYRDLSVRYRSFDLLAGLGSQNDLRSVSKYGRITVLSALYCKIQGHILQFGDRDIGLSSLDSIQRIQLSICRPQIRMVAAYANLRCFLRDIFELAVSNIAERPGTVANEKANVRLRIRITGYRITKLHPGPVQIRVLENLRIRTHEPKSQSAAVERRYNLVVVLGIRTAPSRKDITCVLCVQFEYLQARLCCIGRKHCDSHALVCSHLGPKPMRPESYTFIELHGCFSNRIFRVRNRNGQI